MDTIELFSFEGCPYAQRSRMMLVEKNIDCKMVEIDLKNRPNWFSKLAPLGKVPLLRHNGHVIYESRIINEYLEEVFPLPKLLPNNNIKRAITRFWVEYCDSYFMPALRKLNVKNRNKDYVKNCVSLAKVFNFIEDEAFSKNSTGPFLMGASVTLADIQFMPFIERFSCYEELWGVKVPSNCDQFNNWVSVMKTRDSYRMTCKPHSYHLKRYTAFTNN